MKIAQQEAVKILNRQGSITLRELKAARQAQCRQMTSTLIPMNVDDDRNSNVNSTTLSDYGRREIDSELKFNLSRRQSCSTSGLNDNYCNKENVDQNIENLDTNRNIPIPKRSFSRGSSRKEFFQKGPPIQGTQSITSDLSRLSITEPEGWDKDIAKTALRYMLAAEHRLMPSGMASTNIRPHMRAVLCDWMIQVQHHLRLLPSTLYLAVQYTDRFIRMEKTELGSYQLLGVTALLVASKMEERYQPEVSQLVYLTDNTYTVADVIGMERKILDVLDFRLCTPEASFFLRLAVDTCSDLNDDQKDSFLLRALYLLDLFLVDETWSKTAPSFAAAAALALVLEVEKLKYPRILEYLFGYRATELRCLMIVMARFLLIGDQGKLSGCFQKYCSVSQYTGLAKDVWTRCATVQKLAAKNDPNFLSAL